MNDPTRRDFLNQVGAASVTGLLAAETDASQAQPAGPPRDQPRQLKPTGADMGSLYPEIDALLPAINTATRFSAIASRISTSSRRRPATRFLTSFSTARPASNPRPRCWSASTGAITSAKRSYSRRRPNVRVPAYVLIPKNRKRPGPAIVDLHSHGGMFLFGKEKVIDLGNNHPAMTGYHKVNYDGRPTATALVQPRLRRHQHRRLHVRRTPADDATPTSRPAGTAAKYTLDDVKRLNQQCRAKETTLAKSMVFAGADLAGHRLLGRHPHRRLPGHPA